MYAAETFGIDLLNIRLGGESLADWIRDAGIMVVGVTALAEGVGVVAASVANALGVTVSVPVVGWVIAGLLGGVVGAVRLARAINCADDARRDRDHYTAAVGEIVDLVLVEPSPHLGTFKERLNFRVREAMVFLSGAYDIPESRGRLRWGGWVDKRPPAGMRWTDGSDGRRSGADYKFGGQPCKKKTAFRGMRVAAEQLRDALAAEPDPRNRTQILLTTLGMFLGHEGNPYVGLVDAFVHAGASYRAEATRQVGFGARPPLDARSITHIGVFRLDDANTHFVRADWNGDVGAITWPVDAATQWLMVVRFNDGSRFATLEYVDPSTLDGWFSLPAMATMQARPDLWPTVDIGGGAVYTWGQGGVPDAAIQAALTRDREVVNRFVPGIRIYTLGPVPAQMAHLIDSRGGGGSILPWLAAAGAAVYYLKKRKR